MKNEIQPLASFLLIRKSMFHLLRCKNVFCGINVHHYHDGTIQPFLLNPSRKCHAHDRQTNALMSSSPLLQYLRNSLGFSPERACKVFKQLQCKNPKNPDAAVTFFKSHGLSQTHIQSIIYRAPYLLNYASSSSLRLKSQFLKDKGISDSDLVNIMVSNPNLFLYSVERFIKPVFDVIRSILGTDDFALRFLIRSKFILNPRLLSANLTILKNCGVPSSHISKWFMLRSRSLQVSSDRFLEVVEIVKGMGFKPQNRLFLHAVFTITGLARQKWDTKFKVYSSLGWSDEEILSLFRKYPDCMTASEEKIRKNFHYLTKELGCDRSYILTHPSFLFHGLEKRIIPRHRFLQFLALKGLIKNDETLANRFKMSEKRFLKYFVMRYESKVPDIMNIYAGLIGSKQLNIKDENECNAM